MFTMLNKNDNIQLIKRGKSMQNNIVNKRQEFEMMFYSQDFLSALDELEKQRKKSFIKILIITLALVGIISAMVYLAFKTTGLLDLSFVVSVLSLSWYALSIIGISKDFIHDVKSKLMPMILHNIGDIKWLIGNEEMQDLKALEYLQEILDTNESAEGND